MGLFRSLVTQLTPAPRGRVEEVNGVAMADTDLDPEIAYGGHVCLSMTFLLTTLAYTAFALFAFFTRPETETFLQLPTSQFGPVPLQLEVGCNNAPNCGNVIIGVNYTGVDRCAGLDTNVTSTSIANTLVGTTAPVTRQLCFTEQQLYSVDTTAYIGVTGVQVDFSAINPGINKSTTPHSDEPSLRATGSVRVTAPQLDAAFRRLVNMDTWQVKTLVLGQNVKRRDGVVVERTLFPISIQYEGKRPNWRATMFIALAPLSNVFDTERPGTLMETIASIGGATSMITAALIVVTPLVSVLLPGEAKGASVLADPHAADEDDDAVAIAPSEPISDAEATPHNEMTTVGPSA